MRREQLDHLLRAASQIVGERDRLYRWIEARIH